MRDPGLNRSLPRPEESWAPGSRRSTAWDRVRLTVLVCWLLLAVALVGAGERRSSLADLDAAVSAGRVSSVRVAGGLPAGTTGYGVVDVHWRTGLLGHVTEVLQATRGTSVPGGAGDGAPIVRGEVGARFLAESPQLRVDRADSTSSSAEVAGFRAPSWVGVAELLLGLVVLNVLVSGPQPWRATRWAWFWLMAASGAGLWAVPAMLALSGPTPLVPTPRRGRRLTGGKALVLALVLRAVAGAYL